MLFKRRFETGKNIFKKKLTGSVSISLAMDSGIHIQPISTLFPGQNISEYLKHSSQHSHPACYQSCQAAQHSRAAPSGRSRRHTRAAALLELILHEGTNGGLTWQIKPPSKTPRMKLRECVSSVQQYPRNTYSTSHPCIRIAFMIINYNKITMIVIKLHNKLSSWVYSIHR